MPSKTHCLVCASRKSIWEADNADYIKQVRAEKRQDWKLAAFEVYGTKCVCCDLSNPDMLTLDHINGGGKKHRKDLVGHESGGTFYAKLAEVGYPPILQTMCWNCNFVKHMRGSCSQENHF